MITLFCGCLGERKVCKYEVYQNGILIDKVELEEHQCNSEKASAFSDIYYKWVK